MKVVACPVKGLPVREGEPELIAFVAVAVACLVHARTETGVPPDHSAQVATLVFRAVLRPIGEAAHAHQLVVNRQERALQWSLLGPRDVLPAALGEETVVAASH